jgi:hypothetical protein
MPIYLGNNEILTEYVDSYGLGEIYLGTTLVQASNSPNPFIRATGGTITFSGNYKIHTFTSVGTSSFNIVGLGNTPTNNTIDYLVVAGGGGGNLVHIQGGSNRNGGIGGGAGEVATGSLSATLGANNIIVGAGGLGTQTPGDQDLPGLNGNNSFALGIIASFGYGATNGDDSTGGKSGNGYGKGANTFVQSAPGGGGASEVGYASGIGNASNGGDGGNGFASSISGVSTYYGGGGAGSPPNGGKGQGGLGGGGDSGGAVGQNGEANTGGGGGGAAQGTPGVVFGGNGGSGIVILRYLYQ